MEFYVRVHYGNRGTLWGHRDPFGAPYWGCHQSATSSILLFLISFASRDYVMIGACLSVTPKSFDFEVCWPVGLFVC